MYIMTEDNKILNLDHYFKIGIYLRNGTYKLRANYLKGDKSIPDEIASFEKQEEAEGALTELFQSMSKHRTWDVRLFKQREAVRADL